MHKADLYEEYIARMSVTVHKKRSTKIIASPGEQGLYQIAMKHRQQRQH